MPFDVQTISRLLIIQWFVATYLLLAWIAYCVFTVIGCISLGGTPWIYHLLGFIISQGPSGFLAHKEGPEGPGCLSCLTLVLGIVAYFVFTIWPNIAVDYYGYLRNIL